MDTFIAHYFASTPRAVLLIAGAGFDPRSAVVATRIAAVCKSIQALFVREKRPAPAAELTQRAASNQANLGDTIPQHSVVQVDIFDDYGAVVAGRNAVNAVRGASLEGITDVVVDVSALSVGTSFPIIRYLVELIERGKGPPNLHLFVAHDPTLDADIGVIASDAPGYVHGFKGSATLEHNAHAAKLWLPQLAKGRRAALTRLHQFVSPHDTCPILPFPATDPRLGDALADEYSIELESAWSVDTRNIVFADEADPLDLYRTILRLDDLRKPVFEEVGGSLLILSPLGSKIMAIGALMAALERDLPVAYVEAIGYSLKPDIGLGSPRQDLVHIWLEGEAYPLPRPALKS